MKPKPPPTSLGQFKRNALMLSMDDHPHGGASGGEGGDGGGITIVNPKMVVVMVKGPGGQAVPPGTHLMDDDDMPSAPDEDTPPARPTPKADTRYGK